MPVPSNISFAYAVPIASAACFLLSLLTSLSSFRVCFPLPWSVVVIPCLHAFSAALPSPSDTATRFIFWKHSTDPATLQLKDGLWLAIDYTLKSIFLSQVFKLQSTSPHHLSCTIESNQINIQTLSCHTFEPLFLLPLLLSLYVQTLPCPERLSSNGASAMRSFWIPLFIIQTFVCSIFFFREKHISSTFLNIWSYDLG